MIDTEASPKAMASPMTNNEPPNLSKVLDESVDDRMITGKSRLRITRILFFNVTDRSARANEARMSPVRGGWMVCGVWVLVTDFPSGQADEHVFESDVATGHGLDIGVVTMGVDKDLWPVDGQHVPVIDDGHSVTDRRRLFHRVGGEDDASSFAPDSLQPLPQVPARLGVEGGGGLVEE
jgi:hypothetical protein